MGVDIVYAVPVLVKSRRVTSPYTSDGEVRLPGDLGWAKRPNNIFLAPYHHLFRVFWSKHIARNIIHVHRSSYSCSRFKIHSRQKLLNPKHPSSLHVYNITTSFVRLKVLQHGTRNSFQQLAFFLFTCTVFTLSYMFLYTISKVDFGERITMRSDLVVYCAGVGSYLNLLTHGLQGYFR